MHPLERTHRKHHKTRMMWYYESIIDWMIANPGGKLQDCAAYIGKSPTTLSMIINSDLFKSAYQKRREEFRAEHDFSLINKTTKIAHASLDAILGTLEKKKDQVPLQILKDISDSALSRLGYGADKSSPVTVNVGPNAGATQVVLPSAVSAADIEEARMAVRQVEQNRLRGLPAPHTTPLLDLDAEATESPSGPEPDKREEAVDAPATDPA